MNNLLPLFQRWQHHAPEEIQVHNPDKPVWGFSAHYTCGDVVYTSQFKPTGYCEETDLLLGWLYHCINARGYWINTTYYRDRSGYAVINGSVQHSASTPVEAVLTAYCSVLERDSANA